MARLLFVLIAVAVTFMVYSLVDTILRPARFVRGLPKAVWVLIVIFIPVIGGALWFLIGRGRRSNAPMNRMTAPDDDPEFLRGLNNSGSSSTRSSSEMPTPESTDENIRDLEKRFADLNFDGPEGPSADPTGRGTGTGSGESGSGSGSSGSGSSGSGSSGSGKTGTGKTGTGKTGSEKTGSGKTVSGESVSGDDESTTGRSDRKPGPAA
jgi:uncharacterized membrane protein YgcG